MQHRLFKCFAIFRDAVGRAMFPHLWFNKKNFVIWHLSINRWERVGEGTSKKQFPVVKLNSIWGILISEHFKHFGGGHRVGRVQISNKVSE